MARRPLNGRPYRPFAGQRLKSQAREELRDVAPQAIAPVIVAPTAAPPEPETVVAPQTYDAPPLAREAWESMLDAAPSVPDVPSEPIVEKAPEIQVSSVAEEVHDVAAREDQGAVDGLTSVFEWTGPEPAEPPQAVVHADPDVTAEVPAFDALAEVADVVAYVDDADEAPAEVDEVVAIESVTARKAFETPIYITPANQASVETLIDEVDAAFITSGLPTNSVDTSERAAHAAAMLESIARRLRSGEIKIGSASDSKLNSEESALATVLAALLANR